MAKLSRSVGLSGVALTIMVAAGPNQAGPATTQPSQGRVPAGETIPRPLNDPAGLQLDDLRDAAAAANHITLNFKNAPIDSVLDHLSEAAGFVIVKDGAMEGRVTVLSKQPISADEAVTLLNAVLKTQGYTAIANGRTLKIVAREKAKKSNLPVHFGANPDDIESTDELITQVIPIATVDALKLKQDLTPLLGQEADVTANGGSNAIVVTDTSANVRRIVQIISALDRSDQAGGEIRSFPLKNANAAATAKLLLAIFKPGDQQPRGGEGKPKESAEMALRAKLNAAADDRTNTLFVTAPPETMKTIDGIVKGLEANPAATSEIKIFTPKFADAASAAKLITAVFKPEEATPRRDGEGSRYRDGGLDAALKGRVVAAADDRSNTLVVTAPSDTLKIIESILTKMDVDPTETSEVKVIPLTYADAASVSKMITTLFKADDMSKAVNPNIARQYGINLPDQVFNARFNAAADDRTNSIVISAPKSTAKAIEGVVKLLDVNPATAAVTKVFTLKNATASTTASLVTTIYKSEEPVAGVAAKQTPESLSVAERARRNRLNVASDDRTNSLVVSAPPEMLADVENVIKELDANNASEETFFIYRLKNGQSQNVEAVMNTLFGVSANNGLGPAGRFLQNQQRGGRNNNNPYAALGLGALGSSRGGGTGIGSRRGSSSLGGFGDGRLQQALLQQGGFGPGGIPSQLSQGSQRAVNEMTGMVFVVADQDTNSLLVTTATKYQERVKQIIQELDRPSPQVLIKVLVAEVTHDDSSDFGVDFSVLNRRTNGNGQSAGANFGNAAAGVANGGLVVNVLETNVQATLRALAQNGKLDVLSRPYILASDNQLASITVGQEVPFITNSRVTDQGQTINTIEYQDVGIILNVTPHINPDGQVILDVAPEISQLTGTSVPISETATAPVIAKRSAESRVGVKNGHTIVIGGLMEDRKTQTISKVPILGDLPLIGMAFQRTQETKSKTELLIFLTPHVALAPENLKPMTEDEIRGTKLTPHAVGPGTLDQQMQGLQRGATVITTQPAATAPGATLPGGVTPPTPREETPGLPATRPMEGR